MAGDLVTGDHSWYVRMKPADRRAYALMGYEMFAVAVFFLLGLAVLLVAGILPAIQQPPTAVVITLLFGAALVCLLLFMVTSVVGLIGMMARSRPRAMADGNLSGQAHLGTRRAVRLRRVSAVVFGLVTVLVAPLVLTGELPVFFFVVLFAPAALFILSFIATEPNE